MPENTPSWYLVLYVLLGVGGVGGLAQIIHALIARKRQRPEIDSIIAEGAKNAVESLQVALTLANAELKLARSRIVEMETHYESEIAGLLATIEAMKGSLASAENRAKLLAAELRKAREERTSVVSSEETQFPVISTEE